MDLVKQLKRNLLEAGNAHRIFQENLRINPYYPFTRVGDKKFILVRRYPMLYGGTTLFIVSGLMLLYYFVTKNTSNVAFLYAAIWEIVALFVMWTYKDPRIYTLDGDKELVTFRVGRHVVHASFHQVYIRLMRIKSSRKGHLYHLIFNGCRFEKDIITRASRNMYELRRLGRVLSANLNLNYFDELNMSPHHLVRHARPQMIKKSSNSGGA